jgi:hypothetical protein
MNSDEMRRFNPTAKFLFVIIALILVGCDYGHRGTYRVSAAHSRHADSTTAIVSGDMDDIVKLVEQTLKQLGYEQGKNNRRWWFNPAASVHIELLDGGELKLTLSRIGGSRQMRDARDAELDLVRALSTRTELRIVWLEGRKR